MTVYTAVITSIAPGGDFAQSVYTSDDGSTTTFGLALAYATAEQGRGREVRVALSAHPDNGPTEAVGRMWLDRLGGARRSRVRYGDNHIIFEATV